MTHGYERVYVGEVEPGDVGAFGSRVESVHRSGDEYVTIQWDDGVRDTYGDLNSTVLVVTDHKEAVVAACRQTLADFGDREVLAEGNLWALLRQDVAPGQAAALTLALMTIVDMVERKGTA